MYNSRKTVTENDFFKASNQKWGNKFMTSKLKNSKNKI